jgi:SMP-30/Gluconolactonase/LRE-like region
MTNVIRKSSSDISNKGESVRNAERHAKSASRSESGAFATLANLFGGPGSAASSGRTARPHLLALFCLPLALALALSASTAFAAETHLPLGFSPITGSGSGVTIEAPSGIAVDEASGNVFLNDGANNVVDALGAEGGAPIGLASPFQIPGFAFNAEPSGVAVDNSPTSPNEGTLYVTDVVNQQLKKFTRNAATEVYEADGELTTSDGESFGELLGVAVDANGDVYVTDYNHNSVVEFNPAGTQIARIETIQGVGNPSSVAVDNAGDIFVQGYNGEVGKYPINGSGKNNPADFIPIVSGGTGVAVDTDANRLYVGVGNHVNQYDATTLAYQGEFGGGPDFLTTRLAVNSATGRIYVSNSSAANVVVFGPSVTVPDVTAEAPTGVTRTKAILGGFVNPDNVAVSKCEFEYLTDAEYEGNGDSYEGANAPLTRACAGTIPTDASDHSVTASLTGLTANGTYHFRLSASNANGTSVSADQTFVTVAIGATNPATNNSGTKATLNGTVSPENIAVTECKFEYGTTTAYGGSEPCQGAIPTDEGEHPVTAALTNLQPNGTTYHFRIVVVHAGETLNGADESFLTPTTVLTGAASAVFETAATLNGSVNPDGESLTACEFEYGPTASYGRTIPCNPDFGSIPAEASSHAVTAGLTGLTPESDYHFRLVVADANGEIDGGDETFRTGGQVAVTNPTATTADPTGTRAGLYGSVDPNGEAATYRFEYGTTVNYGSSAPVPDGSLGVGAASIAVSQLLSGLQPGTTYHFRLRAENATNEAVSLDETFTTPSPSETGLPDNRAFELVSPPDKQPAGSVAVANGGNLNYQAAADGEAVGYTLLNGLKDATTGGEIIYVAHRGPGGWNSTQASPPSLVPNPSPTAPSRFNYFSPDIGCGFVTTPSPLTADVPKLDRELQTANLYRRNGDGSFTLVSNLPPSNPGLAGIPAVQGAYFVVAGASPNCDRVYFLSFYQLIPGASGLYEWEDGTLHDAAIRPDGSTAPPLAENRFSPLLGGLGGESAFPIGTRLNSISEDGSRFTFTSRSDEGADSSQQAVFMRTNGTSTVDVSQPTTATSSLGARYELASSDGSHVFFAANVGLAGPAGVGPQESCSEPAAEPGAAVACDLYDYNVEAGTLTDLTTDANPADSQGAALQGVVGASRDGSYVYFAAKGQLVPGRGKTYAQNASGGGSSNVYLAHAGQLTYVVNLTDADLVGNGLVPRPGAPAVESEGSLVRDQNHLTARVTPSGSHLLFQSRSNITGYESSGAAEAYIYSAASNELSCVSCRADGQVPIIYSSFLNSVLGSGFGGGAGLALHYVSPMSDDGSRVFFTSRDALAPGAVEGQKNVYEWENGLVNLLASEAEFKDASANGDDVFITTPRQLDAHDTDHDSDLYDLRVDGGFPPPPPPAVPCDPTAGQCQGPETSAPGAPGISSQSLTGPGNPKPKAPKKHGKHHKKKHHKKKHHKKKHHKKKHHNASTKRGAGRPGNDNRGGAK